MTNLRSKFINSQYDSDSKTSYVTIATRIGNFTGKAKTNTENPSKYFGCDIAEQRALEKAYQQYAKMNKGYAKALRRMYREFSETRTFDENSYQMKMMRARIEWYENEAKDAMHNVDKLEELVAYAAKCWEWEEAHRNEKSTLES